MADFSPYEFLNSKRRGDRLAEGDIRRFIQLFTAEELPDYQMSAFLMAVAIRGMDAGEMATLTQSMLDSGESWALRDRFDYIVDKHSTGGVGDKVSIVLTPWVASCGVKVGMLSGRGLGHTGGTLDKLEAIPGFNARLSRDEFERCIDEVGCAISTSTRGIAPADRRMYALRDVTGTVESLPLITASIMSKKLAMGASALILDVKTGSGAFMSSYADSRALALSLIAAAEGSGTRVEALITDMDRPLGVAAGNANEIAESFAVLANKGPADVLAVTRAQAVRMLVMSGKFDDETAATALDQSLSSGAALEHARKWIAAQGGDPRVVDDSSQLASPARTVEIKADRSGFISAIDTFAAGMLAVDLGAGRRVQDDLIDNAAGLMFDRNVGDEISAGEVIGRIELGDRAFEDDALRQRFNAFVTIADQPPASRRLVHEHLTVRNL